MLMTKRLPEVLPIKGQRIKFYYPGIKTLCLKCYHSGHPKWECTAAFKTNWLEYVFKFFQSDDVSNDMLGSWVNTLAEFHPEFQKIKPLWSKQNPDIRDNLNEKRKLEQELGPSQSTQASRGQKTRGRPVRGRGHFRGKSSSQATNYSQDSNTGRGTYRGRGRGRGRGWKSQVEPGLSNAFYNKNGHFYSDLG